MLKWVQCRAESEGLKIPMGRANDLEPISLREILDHNKNLWSKS